MNVVYWPWIEKKWMGRKSVIDYTPYVLAVYGIAAAVYGFLAWIWHRRLKKTMAQLEEGKKHG